MDGYFDECRTSLLSRTNSCYVRQEIDQIFEEHGKELKPKMIVNSSMLAMQTLGAGNGMLFYIRSIPSVYNEYRKILIFFALGKTRLKKTKTGIMYLKNKILSRQEKYCIAVLKEKINRGRNVGA